MGRIMRAKKWIILLVAVITMPAATFAQDPVFTTASLQETAYAALAHHPRIKAADAVLSASRLQQRQAQSLYHPQVLAEADITKGWIESSAAGSGDGSVSRTYGVSLIQNIWRGGRTVSRLRETGLRSESSQKSYQAEQEDILALALVAAINLHFDNRRMVIQHKIVKGYDTLLTATRRRFEEGEATETDVLQVEGRQMQAAAALVSAGGDAETSRTILERVSGLYVDDVSLQDFDAPLQTYVGEAKSAALARNPDIAALHLRQQAEQERAKGIRGEHYPAVTFEASWTRELDPQPGIVDENETALAGVRASVPLYEGGSIRARRREAEFNAVETSYRLVDLSRGVEENILTLWHDMETAERNRVSAAAEVKFLSQVRDNMSQEIAGGERTLTDLLDASRDMLGAESRLIEAERVFHVARVRLSILTGGLTVSDVTGGM